MQATPQKTLNVFYQIWCPPKLDFWEGSVIFMFVFIGSIYISESISFLWLGAFRMRTTPRRPTRKGWLHYRYSNQLSQGEHEFHPWEKRLIPFRPCLEVLERMALACVGSSHESSVLFYPPIVYTSGNSPQPAASSHYKIQMFHLKLPGN